MLHWRLLWILFWWSLSGSSLKAVSSTNFSKCWTFRPRGWSSMAVSWNYVCHRYCRGPLPSLEQTHSPETIICTRTTHNANLRAARLSKKVAFVVALHITPLFYFASPSYQTVLLPFQTEQKFRYSGHGEGTWNRENRAVDRSEKGRVSRDGGHFTAWKWVWSVYWPAQSKS